MTATPKLAENLAKTLGSGAWSVGLWSMAGPAQTVIAAVIAPVLGIAIGLLLVFRGAELERWVRATRPMARKPKRSEDEGGQAPGGGI